MSLIDRLEEKLRHHPKRIVFPEGADARILQAARQLATRQVAVPILIGDRAEIKDRAARLDLRLDGLRLLEPAESDDLERLAEHLAKRPRFADKSLDERLALAREPNFHGALMVATGRADALLAGATTAAPSALRTIFQVIPLHPDVRHASSLLLLDLENPKVGMGGVLFLADCAVIPQPDEEQLADIALSTASLAAHLTGERPRVAFLSYSTRGNNARNPALERIRSATARAQARARELRLEIDVDGELQVDAALVPVVAAQKGLADSAVAGRANVLVFPDLNAANIASKLVLVLAGSRGYGQILTGLTKPCAEISRGAHAYDIYGAAVLAACQAISAELLRPLDYRPQPGRPAEPRAALSDDEVSAFARL